MENETLSTPRIKSNKAFTNFVSNSLKVDHGKLIKFIYLFIYLSVCIKFLF